MLPLDVHWVRLYLHPPDSGLSYAEMKQYHVLAFYDKLPIIIFSNIFQDYVEACLLLNQWLTGTVTVSD